MYEIPRVGRQGDLRGRGRGRLRQDGGGDKRTRRHGRELPGRRDRSATDQSHARGRPDGTGRRRYTGEQRGRRIGAHVRQSRIGRAHREPGRRQSTGTDLGG